MHDDGKHKELRRSVTCEDLMRHIALPNELLKKVLLFLLADVQPCRVVV